MEIRKNFTADVVLIGKNWLFQQHYQMSKFDKEFDTLGELENAITELIKDGGDSGDMESVQAAVFQTIKKSTVTVHGKGYSRIDLIGVNTIGTFDNDEQTDIYHIAESMLYDK